MMGLIHIICVCISNPSSEVRLFLKIFKLHNSFIFQVKARYPRIVVGDNELKTIEFIGSECPTLVNLVEDHGFISEEY